MYIIKFSLEGSGHNFNFGIHTWYLVWKALMFSLNCLLKMSMSSEEPLKSNQALMLQFMAWGVPSSSFFLNMSLYVIALTLFHYSPSDSLYGYFDLRVLYVTVIGVSSFHSIVVGNTYWVPYLSRDVFEVLKILVSVSDIML